jgi:hypothetical protein
MSYLREPLGHGDGSGLLSDPNTGTPNRQTPEKEFQHLFKLLHLREPLGHEDGSGLLPDTNTSNPNRKTPEKEFQHLFKLQFPAKLP